MGKLAIITARGGSKRIPKKNIKDFFGKPVIAYAIESALNSNLFDKVMVSTDCAEIAEISKKYGAEVPFMRSKKTSDDHATTSEVLLEVLSGYEKISYSPQYACCIYPVTPLIKSRYYIDAFGKLVNDDVDSIFTITKYPVPVEWAFKIDGSNIVACDQEMMEIRSQDIVNKYYDAGQFYFFDVKKFLHQKSFNKKNMGFLYLEPNNCQDVDSPEDWKMLKIKWGARNVD